MSCGVSENKNDGDRSVKLNMMLGYLKDEKEENYSISFRKTGETLFWGNFEHKRMVVLFATVSILRVILNKLSIIALHFNFALQDNRMLS